MSKPKFPVKPVGRILYSQVYKSHYNEDYEKPAPIYTPICECKGFSLKDRPFSVFKREDGNEEKIFNVVYHWRNDKGFKKRIVRIQGREDERTDDDTYYMMEVLERHATLTAAQKAMRRFATEAFAKVNDPPSHGEVCHNTCDGEKELKLRVGDVVIYAHCPGIVWQVKGEKRRDDHWYTQIVPVFSFIVHNGTDNKMRELRAYDVFNYVHHVDIVELGTLYTKLGLFLQDEARRRSM